MSRMPTAVAPPRTRTYLDNSLFLEWMECERSSARILAATTRIPYPRLLDLIAGRLEPNGMELAALELVLGAPADQFTMCWDKRPEDRTKENPFAERVLVQATARRAKEGRL